MSRIMLFFALVLSWLAFVHVVNAGDRITITSADGRQVIIEDGKPPPVWLPGPAPLSVPPVRARARVVEVPQANEEVILVRPRATIAAAVPYAYVYQAAAAPVYVPYAAAPAIVVPKRIRPTPIRDFLFGR